MPNDMMDDGMDGMYPSEGKPAETPETVDQEEQEMSAKTALVSKEALGGECKVGEVYPMKVVAEHGDEVELEYVPSTEKKSTPMTDDEEIDAMDQG